VCLIGLVVKKRRTKKLIYIYIFDCRNRIQNMNVQELRIYPIKSCAGVQVQEALVTRYGLALPSDPRIYDR
jgi:hypothetical protein